MAGKQNNILEILEYAPIVVKTSCMAVRNNALNAERKVMPTLQKKEQRTEKVIMHTCENITRNSMSNAKQMENVLGVAKN
jgi:hypothetical protein